MTSNADLPNSSHCWNQNRRSEQRIRPFATLDLHGLTRENAIRAVTQFWDDSTRTTESQRNPWVGVVTGTGSHSGALGGPVLKQSVHKLLIKRQMEYSYSKKPRGIFLVNVHSGIVLKQNPSTQELQHAAGDAVEVMPETLSQDTKVKVMAREHANANAAVLPAHKKKLLGKKARRDLMAHAATLAAGPQQERWNRGAAPRPTELADDQKLLDDAKWKSLQDVRQRQSQRDKEDHALRQALQTTKQKALEENRLEEEELQRVLALSQEAVEQPPVPDQESELERILQLSLQESQLPRKDTFDEEEWQHLLAQSNMDSSPQQHEEEAELERVLRMSMMESHPRPEIDDEDDALQKVLRMSMVEAAVCDHSDEAMDDPERHLVEEREHQVLIGKTPNSDSDGANQQQLHAETLSGQKESVPMPTVELLPFPNSTTRGRYPESLPSGASMMEQHNVDLETHPEACDNHTIIPVLSQPLHLAVQDLGHNFVPELSHENAGQNPHQSTMHYSASNVKSDPQFKRLVFEQPLAVSEQPALPPMRHHLQLPMQGPLPCHFDKNHAERSRQDQEPAMNQAPKRTLSRTPFLTQHNATAERHTTGEALLEAILSKNSVTGTSQSWRDPPMMKKAPPISASVQFNMDSPTMSNEQRSATLNSSRATLQRPVLPRAMLEERLMEILQRPVILPPPRSTQPAGAPSPSITVAPHVLSPLASTFPAPSLPES